jgi:hypothetical protein
MKRFGPWKSAWFDVRPEGERLGPPSAWLLLFAVLFGLFYLLHGDRISPDPNNPARFDLVAGDEPHYMLLTHSLVADGDFNLLNNLQQEDYRLFYTGSMPDYRGGFASFWKGIVRGRLKNVPDEYWQTHIYSICSPGLPVLLAPAYAAGYNASHRVRFSVTVFMHALAALTGVLTIWLAWRVCRIRFWALFLGFALSLSGPLVFYSMSIYTDLPGALCLAGCFVLLWQWPPVGARRQALSMAVLGTLMGFMVSLHTKFWMPFFYVLAVMIWMGIRQQVGRHDKSGIDPDHRQDRNAAQSETSPYFSRSCDPAAVSRCTLMYWVVPALLFVGGVGVYYWWIFGVPFPVRTYPPFEIRQALISGWPGLWLDQRHGLLWYLPLAFLVIPGVILLAREKDRMGMWVGGLILLHWAGTGLFSDWTGGRCPPMRYWVPIVPLLAVPLAACVRHVSKDWFRFLFAVAGLAGIWIGIFGMLHPRRLYAYAHPVFSYVLDRLYKESAPLFDETWLARNGWWLAGWILATLVASWWISFRALNHVDRRTM